MLPTPYNLKGPKITYRVGPAGGGEIGVLASSLQGAVIFFFESVIERHDQVE